MVLLPHPFILFLRFVQQTELVVPFSFQCIGDETVGRIHVHVPALRQIRFIAGALDLLVA
jgi:hypothetical protein